MAVKKWKKIVCTKMMLEKNVCGAETYMFKKIFSETYMFKKCLRRRICLKKSVCGRTFLIHPLQKNNGPSLIITHTY